MCLPLEIDSLNCRRWGRGDYPWGDLLDFGFLRMGTTGLAAQAAGAGDQQEVALWCVA